MIAANVAAAETLEKHKTPLLYRVHDTPSREKLDCAARFPCLARPALRQVRGRAAGRLQPRAGKGPRGRQHPAGQRDGAALAGAGRIFAHENYGHFGLNLDRYAHFTSPIRRYADLIVHRALIAALGLRQRRARGSRSCAKLPRDRRSTSPSPSVAPCSPSARPSDRLLAQFLATKIGAEFDGRISGVTRSGLFVRLSETGADGFVPASTLGQDYYRYRRGNAGHGRRPHRRDLPHRRHGAASGWSRRRRSPERCASSCLSEGIRGKPSSGKRTREAPISELRPQGRSSGRRR